MSRFLWFTVYMKVAVVCGLFLWKEVILLLF